MKINRTRVRLVGLIVWAAIPLVTLIGGYLLRDPYTFAAGALLMTWQMIDYAADKVIKAITAGSREVVLTIQQPFREKLRDTLAAARIRPTGRAD